MSNERTPRITRHDLDRLEAKVDQIIDWIGRQAAQAPRQTEGQLQFMPGTGHLQPQPPSPERLKAEQALNQRDDG